MRALYVLSWLWLFCPQLALAYTVHLCIDYTPNYTDASSSVGDDYITTSPAAIDASGAKITVKQGSTVIFSGYADDTGCTSGFTASGGIDYDIRLFSEAIVEGNTFDYELYGGGQYYVEWQDVNFTGSGEHDLETGNNHLSRVMGALTFAMTRYDLGVSGETIHVWRNDDGASGPCPSTSCNSGGEIYYLVNTSGVDHSLVKNVLIHELGHKMMNLRIGVTGLTKDDSAPPSGQCPGNSGHSRNSVEYHSIAAIEGYAHYYASVVFNQLLGAGCGAYSHYSVNWDNSGVGEGNLYECDGPPVSGLGLSDGDYLNDQCGTTAGTANEYDYQRFFWDIGDKTPPTGSYRIYPHDIADIIGAAASTPWNAAYATSYPDNLNNPKDLMYDAATVFGTTWDVNDDDNGVAY